MCHEFTQPQGKKTIEVLQWKPFTRSLSVVKLIPFTRRDMVCLEQERFCIIKKLNMNWMRRFCSLKPRDLRAVVSNFGDSGNRAKNSNFFLFAQKNPFGELFPKIIFKNSSEFLFWQENGKFEFGLNRPLDPK